MALPQIQQARIIQAPDVFIYAMREGPRLAEAFTAGLAAGQRARDSKQRAKEVETARGDRLAERNQALLERFGADAVVDPESGTVDVTRSAGAMRERGELAKLAEQAGEVEALGMSMADLPPQARELPEYRAGMARGLAKVRQEDMMLNRISEREKAMLDREKEIEQIQQKGQTERQQMGDSADFVRALLSPRGRSSDTDASDTSVRYTDPDNGAVYTFKSQEAYDKWRGKAPEEQPTGVDPDFTKAAREAIKQYEALKNRGKGADLDFDKSGLPKVTPSGFYDTANDQVIEALRRKVEPQKKLTGRTPVPVFALPNMGVNSVPTNVITR